MRPQFATRSWATVLLLAGCLAFAPSMARAQGIPTTWDHYWVYEVLNLAPVPVPSVTLVDQFGTDVHQVLRYTHFSNPTSKYHDGILYPITRPDLHYLWWEIEPKPFARPGVVVVNQFGPQLIDVFDPRFLLNPARKNQPGPPPPGNHYKCYQCAGQAVQVGVDLQDQFGQRHAVVLQPELLCNPAAKVLPDGQQYPIEDPNQHLVCYRIEPMVFNYTAVVTDQFVRDYPLVLGPDRWLCVPSEKHEPTPTVPSTWGRLKALYR